MLFTMLFTVTLEQIFSHPTCTTLFQKGIYSIMMMEFRDQKFHAYPFSSVMFVSGKNNIEVNSGLRLNLIYSTFKNVFSMHFGIFNYLSGFA